jgi:hypothetical protein
VQTVILRNSFIGSHWPIHIFLNTENMQRYYESKKHCHDFSNLRDYVCHYEDSGTRVFLNELKRA